MLVNIEDLFSNQPCSALIDCTGDYVIRVRYDCVSKKPNLEVIPVSDLVDSMDKFVVSMVQVGSSTTYRITFSDASYIDVNLSGLISGLDKQKIVLMPDGHTIQILDSSGNPVAGSQIDICPIIQTCLASTGLPSGIGLFTQNGVLIQTGSTHTYTILSTANTIELLLDGSPVSSTSIINSINGSWASAVYTMSINGVNHPIDFSSLAGLSIFSSDDDQLLIADPSSINEILMVPTTVPDPDGQTNKINYTVSSTIKSTYILSGNPVSSTNKVVTQDSLTAQNITYGLISVKDTLDALTTNSHVPADIDPATNPALSAVVATQKFKLDLTTPGSFNPGATGLPTNIEGAILALYNTIAANDEVQPYANYASFPATGQVGVLYIATNTGMTYTWNGTSYVASSDKEVYMYATYNTFPAVGVVDKIYIAKDTWVSYARDTVSSSYKPLDKDVLRYNSISNFPAPGDPEKMYVDETADKVYKYDPATATYVEVSGNDDVLPFPALANFPAVGETGKYYIDLSTDKTYIWDTVTSSYVLQGAITASDVFYNNTSSALPGSPSTVQQAIEAVDAVLDALIGTVGSILSTFINGAENGLHVVAQKVREGGTYIVDTTTIMSGFYKKYISTNLAEFFINGSNGDVNGGGEIFTWNAQRIFSRGNTQNQGFLSDGSGLRVNQSTGRNANNIGVGTIYEDVDWNYTENVGGGIAEYHPATRSQWKRTGTVWEHFMNWYSKDGRYFWGNGLGDNGPTTVSLSTLPSVSSASTDKVLLVSEINGETHRSEAPLERIFALDYAASTTPGSFIRIDNNTPLNATLGGYDYYLVQTDIALQDPPYIAPAGYRWQMDVDYSEQQVTEDAINNIFSYVYFQNIGINIRESNLSDIIVGDSITFANRRVKLRMNNTGNSLRIARFQRIKSGLTMYTTAFGGGFTEYQYASAIVSYELVKII